MASAPQNRSESLAESLLIAAGVRRSRTITARTQWRKLDPESRDAAKAQLAAWWGGSYRAQPVTTAATRRRRRTHERRAVLAATGFPVGEQPRSHRGVDQAWNGLPAVTRAAAQAFVESIHQALGPTIDLDAIPAMPEPTAPPQPDEEVSDDDLEALLAGKIPTDAEPDEPPSEVTDAELLALLEGPTSAPPTIRDVPEEIDGWFVVPEPPDEPGHFSGPDFDTPYEAAEYAEDNGYDRVARIHLDDDEEHWRLFFPEHSP